jgi:hypothetical protein
MMLLVPLLALEVIRAMSVNVFDGPRALLVVLPDNLHCSALDFILLRFRKSFAPPSSGDIRFHVPYAVEQGG